MGFDVLLQMVLPAESFIAHRTGEWSKSAVDAFVASQLLVTGEGLAAVWMVAQKWSLACKKRSVSLVSIKGSTSTCVNANVTLQLPVVRKRHLTVWTLESFRALLLPAGLRFVDQH